MNIHLVVVRAFGAYAKGQIITDAAAVSDILAGENSHCVVRVASASDNGRAAAAQKEG
jgi:hypothetical protein